MLIIYRLQTYEGVKNQEWMNVVDKMNYLSKYEIAYS